MGDDALPALVDPFSPSRIDVVVVLIPAEHRPAPGRPLGHGPAVLPGHVGEGPAPPQGEGRGQLVRRFHLAQGRDGDVVVLGALRGRIVVHVEAVPQRSQVQIGPAESNHHLGVTVLVEIVEAEGVLEP